MVGAAQPQSSALTRVWVRRCRRCGTDDLRSTFGQPAIIDNRRWFCPVCEATSWVAVRLDFPTDADTARCPYGKDQA